MFGFIPAAEQAIRERVKNEALTEASNRTAANVDYIAMMCDIDLDSDTEIINELEPTENGKIIAGETGSRKESGDNE